MISIPRELYNDEIKSFIDEMITYENAQDFASIDDTYQDKFVSLCIRALGCDTEIVLSQKANGFLASYLLTDDRDDEIEFMKSFKESTREQFSVYFDQIIKDENQSRNRLSMYEKGKKTIVDNINGEKRWY